MNHLTTCCDRDCVAYIAQDHNAVRGLRAYDGEKGLLDTVRLKRDGDTLPPKLKVQPQMEVCDKENPLLIAEYERTIEKTEP